MSETIEAKWYVIQARAGYENIVATNLATVVQNRGMQDVIQDVKIPTQTVTEINNGKERQVERKLFPNYVCVKMILNPESWFVVRNIRGCTGFLGADPQQPTPLPNSDVITWGLEGNNVEEHGVEVGYSEGDNVKIISGPLEGYGGVVKSIDLANNSVCVVLSMFGRETPVELELDQISRED